MEHRRAVGAARTFDESQKLEDKSAKWGLGKSAMETILVFSNEPSLGGGFLILGVEATSAQTQVKR